MCATETMVQARTATPPRAQTSTALWPLLAPHPTDAFQPVLPLHLLCINTPRYIVALLLSLNTMLHLELPHINVLSKIDLVRQYGKLGEV